VKVPASLTESGFVPPELKVNEKAAPPFVNVPDPKGLVRVRTFAETTHPVGLMVAEAVVIVQAASSTNSMEDGKVITNFESVGIA